MGFIALKLNEKREIMADSGSTYQQQAYEYLKTNITNLGFKPGEYITDAQIAGQLNISRTPVREAFHRLENEGLLNYEMRRGWKVHTLSLEDIRDIFDIKIELEGMMARKAAECDDETLRSALRDTFEKMSQAAEQDDMDAWIEADVDFHQIIADMAQNLRAERIVKNLNDQWYRVRIGFTAMQGRMGRSTYEHQLLTKNILDGNGDKAEAQMRDHLHNLQDELTRVLVNMVLPFAPNGV
jgi:DNA-binding GntR family transcriptional regulator